MCGIYGATGPLRKPLFGLSAIRRRGPDDCGHWADEEARVWLGHVRLSILDTSAAGHQPMVSHDGRIVMAYNGEIYNYRELREALEVQGEQFSGNSDSEVLLALFARDGVRCFEALNGIFAAAFWERDSATLTLVRDPLGVKPLYLAECAGRLAFASELKALLRAGDVTPDLNPLAVLHHLGYLWSPGSGTIVKGVRKLLPGYALQARHGEVLREWRYRDIGFSSAVQVSLSVDEAARQVAAAVEEAVRRQMVADVPLGAFLSGGLDSSAVVAFAQRHRSAANRLQCFSIEVTDGSTATEGFADDLPYARRVADHLGVDLHVVKIGGEMMDRLPEMIYLLDEPTPDPAALNALFISELARSQGIKVLLSGAGGDDIFTGYRRHFALTQERWWSWWPAPLRRGLSDLSGSLSARTPLLVVSAKRSIPGLDSERRLASYFLWMEPARACPAVARNATGLERRSDVHPLVRTLGNYCGHRALNRMLTWSASIFHRRP